MSAATPVNISQQQIDDFASDGAVFLPGLFTDWVAQIRAAIDENMQNPARMRRKIWRPGIPAGFLMTIATGSVLTGLVKYYAIHRPPPPPPG